MVERRRRLPNPERTYVRLLLLTAAIIVAGLVVWRLSDLLLLVFGSVLVAVGLDSLAELIERHARLPRRWSLPLAVLAILLLFIGFIAVLGAQLWAQVVELVGRLPELVTALEQRFGIANLDDWIAERLRLAMEDFSLMINVAGVSSWIVEVLATLFLVVVAGVYLAVQPHLYHGGVMALFPRRDRREVDETLRALGGALRLWLLGQLAAMLLVGCLVATGLWLIGIPSALALGFIAGLLEFIPYLGPILSAVPAVAFGLVDSPVTGLWVAGLYFIVQQIEAVLITPLVQERAVHLAPALTIFSIFAFGLLFGPLGVLFATPLTVVSVVVVKKLWIREVLAEETDIPGEKPAK